jgi:hypothetical protein
LYPLPEIAFSSWITELTSLRQEGVVFFHGANITILKKPRRKE